MTEIISHKNLLAAGKMVLLQVTNKVFFAVYSDKSWMIKPFWPHLIKLNLCVGCMQNKQITPGFFRVFIVIFFLGISYISECDFSISFSENNSLDIHSWVWFCSRSRQRVQAIWLLWKCKPSPVVNSNKFKPLDVQFNKKWTPFIHPCHEFCLYFMFFFILI